MNFHPSPKIVPKPWGCEVWWAHCGPYVGKLLIIKKGHRLSLQYHRKKHETIYTLRGRWRLLIGRKGSLAKSLTRSIQRPGSATVIPPMTMHRFEAPFGRVTLIEASTPHVRDVVRLQDDYRREKNG